MAATRGTTNRNDRGNSEDRRRRREWLVKTFRADRTRALIWEPGSTGKPDYVNHVLGEGGHVVGLQENWGRTVELVPVCRCYRCGKYLSADEVSPDRIVPGCAGGTYRRDNIRPACNYCQSVTGQALSVQRRKAKKRKTPKNELNGNAL